MTTERKRRVDEIGDESRQRILDAAEALFAERGFERTSFVDIAERCGISRGSIPWHFTNKDGLLLAVVERALARATTDSQSVEHGDVRGRFVDFHRRGRAGLAELVRKSGADRADVDPDVLAGVINGALLGLHLQWTLDDRVDLDAGLDLLRRLVERGLSPATDTE